MEVIEKTAVRMVVPSNEVSLLVGHIEKCEVLRDDGKSAEVLIYWGIEEMQRLVRVYGEAPSPIYEQYDWPGMYTPFVHQKTTASYLALRDRVFCFNEAGTGKTSSVIWAADYLMKAGMI